ncbi:ABC transporter permease subunit [Cocleimonas flava]|uniref:Putrescine transport system permease protein n=1 Tax=Cocleimonas flava TaxID=634765 RepID=A0A4R1ERG3_9GAMM|nr:MULTISPECIES: ABC transporter permease subunit [Cocleimonas]MEB8432650.1 ABC transporter permease subunit [Cocleimonas sp. KMM 6892]MEC4715509.1 ABC transporter permease subunit [Cocleimonas sp. KMM 6895]MEC4744873.1 ABC transporter permease subunit [Cocleimonas sp. KMM 6896]TCJ83060.1 putrescine transport system permease protein [Cocleimonas flava]
MKRFLSLFSKDSLGKKTIIGIPYIWFLIFFLLPLFYVLKISFSESIIASPPIAPLFEYDGDEQTLISTLRLSNYGYLIEDNLYLLAYLSSIKIAFFSTLITLLIGYPMALAITRANKRLQLALLLLVMLPFFTSLLIRVYAWIGILRTDGTINTILMFIGVIDEPIVLLQTEFAMYLGIVYAYLPFMILPLYAALEKQDKSLLEAARDLGASPAIAFLTVTLPASVSGIVAGCMLVFIPAVGEFVIPSLLGGESTLMIGRVLWDEFFANRDWPVASAVAIVMLAILIIPIMLFQNQQAKSSGE